MAKDKKNKAENPLKGGKDEATTVKKKKGALADPAAGDMFKMADNLGALIIVDAQEYEKDFVTENGPSNIIRGDITVLTEEDGKTRLKDPVEYTNTIIFGTAVVASLKSMVGSGQLVVGVVGQGVKKAGKNAPWLLEAASDKQKKIAQAFLDE